MAWQIYTTGMVECSWLHPPERYKVWDCPIQSYHRVPTTNQHDCNHAITSNILETYAVSGYHPQAIANTSWDVFTRKKSKEARFRETTGILTHRTHPAETASDSSLTRNYNLLDLLAFAPPYSIPSYSPYTNLSQTKKWWLFLKHRRSRYPKSVFSGQILLKCNLCPDFAMCQNFQNVTSFWNLILRQCMCNDHTDHANVVHSKSGSYTTNTIDQIMPISVKRESRTKTRG